MYELTTESLLEEAQQHLVITYRQSKLEVDLNTSNNIDLSGLIDLQDCDFTASRFIGTVLQDAKLQGSDFTGVELISTDLTNADLSRSLHTGNSTKLNSAALIEATLQRANLSYAEMTGANLESADLSFANMKGAVLLNANLKNTKLDHTVVSRNSIGSRVLQERFHDYTEAKFIYLSLKNNFITIGAYDDASWAYTRERTMQRKAISPTQCGRFFRHELEQHIQEAITGTKVLTNRLPRLANQTNTAAIWIGNATFRLKYLFRWLADLLVGAPWGYGERPINAVGVAFMAVLSFAGVFALSGGIEAVPVRSLTVVDYLVYSAGSFASVSFSDMAPVTMWSKAITVVEAVLGLVTFTILVNALARRIGGH